MLRKASHIIGLLVMCIVLWPGVARAERVKGRVYDVDERHSEVRLDVAGHHRTYHIEDAACIDASGLIRHKPYGVGEVAVTQGWLPAGPVA